MSGCNGKTKSGAQCRSNRVLTSGYCRHHETDEAREHRLAREHDELRRQIEKTLARSRRRTAKLERRNARMKRLIDGIRQRKSASEIGTLLANCPTGATEKAGK